jgi:hypothetical protein
MAFRFLGTCAAVGWRYILRQERNKGEVGAFWRRRCQDSAESASQRDWSQGRVERSSKADMQSDWQKRTACWVSHMKQRKASLRNRERWIE